MASKKILYAAGIVTILISLITWSVDFMQLVNPCIYCRTERTVIGILGLIMLVPVIPYVTQVLSLSIGFFGASVASQHLFMIIMKFTNSEELVLVMCALLIIITQMYFINYYSRTS